MILWEFRYLIISYVTPQSTTGHDSRYILEITGYFKTCLIYNQMDIKVLPKPNFQENDIEDHVFMNKNRGISFNFLSIFLAVVELVSTSAGTEKVRKFIINCRSKKQT